MATERIPRASISVLFFSDPDTMALIARGAKGERAVLLFIQLLVEAKVQRNNGEFTGGIDVYASKFGLSPDRARACVALINDVCDIHGTEPWIEVHTKGFRIRSFAKFNAPAREDDDAPPKKWGGARPNSGPKKGSSSSLVQDEPPKVQDERTNGFILGSNTCASVTVSVTDKKTNSKVSHEPDRDLVVFLEGTGMGRTAVQALAFSPNASLAVAREVWEDVKKRPGVRKPPKYLAECLAEKFQVTFPTSKSITPEIQALRLAIAGRKPK